MKIERPYPQLTITDKGFKFLKQNSWVYEDEVIEINGDYQNGDVVDVVSLKGKYVGSGFISDKSKVKVRLFSRNASETFNDEFFSRRIRYAIDYRKTVMDNLDNCRLVFGEADGLPGVTVDKFNDVLVCTILSFGMERIKKVLYDALLYCLSEDGEVINAIYERNDNSGRLLEGLEENKGYYWKNPDVTDCVTVIDENGIKFVVDYENGQKTGYFLDQKFNRLLVRNVARNKKVLDCFTHTGSFALNCAYGGAISVTAVDISETAIETAKLNAEINGLSDKVEFVVDDVFDFLDKTSKREYDMIILDPPAFTKSRSTIQSAYNGYRQINEKAMQILGKGGYLVSCSCSHFMSQKLYEQMLLEAARNSNVQLKQVSFTQQGKDHPILLNEEQTNYLKFYIFQIV